MINYLGAKREKWRLTPRFLAWKTITVKPK